MTKKVTIFLKKNNAPAQVRKALDHILYELEHYGRTITPNGKASRYLSFRMKYPKENQKIFFTWCKQHHQSIIALAPETKLERVSDNKVKLIYEGFMQKKE